MSTYFMSIVEEIKYAIQKCPDAQHIDNLLRHLGSFRLPILLYFPAGVDGAGARVGVIGENVVANAYFDIVFGSFAEFMGVQGHLLEQSPSAEDGFTPLILKRRVFEAYVGTMFFLEKPYKLFVLDYRIEYAKLLTRVEKFLLVDLVHKTSDFVGIADEIGNFVYINEAGLSMLKYAPDDAHLLNVWDLHDHKELRQILESGLHEDGNFSWVGQVRIKTRLGKWIFCSQSVTSHMAGGQRYYATVMRDMTLIKRIEEQVTSASARINATVAARTEEIVQLNIQLLHEIEASERMRHRLMEREKRLSTIIETTLDGFFMLDDNLKIERTNRAFKVLVHGVYKELEGERMLRFLTYEGKISFRDMARRASKGEHILENIAIQCLDGKIELCSLSLNPFMCDEEEVDADGRIHYHSRYRGLFGFVRPLSKE